MDATPRPQNEKMPSIWPFFAALPISLLMAIALTPHLGGEFEYLISYTFLMLCACGYLAVGTRKHKNGYIYIAILMTFLNPILPILVAASYDAVFIQNEN
jgi:hypothetical protein